MRKVFGFAACLALATLSSRSARAEGGDVPGWVGKVIEALRSENPAELIGLVETGDRDALVALPSETWKLAKATAKYVPKWGLGEFHEIAEKMVAWMQKVADDTAKAAPQDSHTKRTQAASHATKARFDVVRGGQVAPDDWVAAADLVSASYATDKDADNGEAAGLAVGWLRDGAVLDGMDLAALASKLDPLAKVIDPLPAAEGPDMAKAQLRLLQALLVPATAKASIDSFFTVMDSYAKPGCAAPIATLYNEGVTFAKSKKMTVKGDYMMSPKTTSVPKITFQLIQSERWKPFTGNERVLGGFHEYDQYGRTTREVTIEMFHWNVHYEADGKVFGGAEAKGLARLVQGWHKDDFSKINATKELMKGNFAKGMPPSEYFDMQGIDSNNLPLRIRVHFVKGKEAPETYGITIKDFGTLPEGDPEMKVVLDTFAEIPKKK